MADALALNRAPARCQDVTSEAPRARFALTGIALAYLGLLLILPLAAVFSEALGDRIGAYLAALTERDALTAIRLTLTVAAISVPLNVVFGLAAAWAIAKFEFRGKA
ncbi:MAG TPA: sulfate ABC transporter permease subunit CysW, partial [Paracoccaceae bacterium]|nr:sulfate ABC transporter permease subunit CysW [Paracoccaceae bacterium]